ncbi:hypothetical protein KEM55_003381 [Ascosphaera atra]|nr:hypothetical protein KEM55_003381 [Ascosphaera atra]
MVGLLARTFSDTARATEYKHPDKQQSTGIKKHLKRVFFYFTPRFCVMLAALVTMGYEINDSFHFRDRGKMNASIAASVVVAASELVPFLLAFCHACIDRADMYDSIKAIRYCAGTFHLMGLLACLIAIALYGALPNPRLKSPPSGRLEFNSCRVIPDLGTDFQTSNPNALNADHTALCGDAKWTFVVLCFFAFWEAMEYHLFATAAVYWP